MKLDRRHFLGLLTALPFLKPAITAAEAVQEETQREYACQFSSPEPTYTLEFRTIDGLGRERIHICQGLHGYAEAGEVRYVQGRVLLAPSPIRARVVETSWGVSPSADGPFDFRGQVPGMVKR